MNQRSRKVEWIVWSVLGVTALAILVAFIRQRMQPDSQKSGQYPVLFSVRPFVLTNQHGHLFGTEDLRGRAWLADIVFTSCAGPCPRMTSLMSGIQHAISPAEPIRFVTLTTDPEHDTPAVLARYGRQNRADPERWFFLTGSKSQIKEAAVTGLKFTALEKDPAQKESDTDLFIHSTIFVAIDKRGNARAIFETDQPDAREKILTAIRALARE
jgi:cytochrome oxidase Cu insertion factor (SCO1/SenC/PrrC family)